jgi:hypothetical protein
MKKFASFIAVLVVLCFATMVMAAEPAKDAVNKSKAAATDTISKPAAGNPDNAAAPANPGKADKKVKKANKKVKKTKKIDVDATAKPVEKAPATPATDDQKKQ